jgi:hypothetical protein
MRRGPHRQRDHIDVLFEAEIAGVTTTFVIEDKTNTSHHDGQLGRYARIHPGAVCSYFKTGYHFDEDRNARAAGYAVIGLGEWVRFLVEHRVRHDVFDDYLRAASKLLEEREAGIAGLRDAVGHQRFVSAAVQFEFLRRLVAACGVPSDVATLRHGSNLDGTPWAHWSFATTRGAFGTGVSESLFHRIDARKGPDGDRRFYLSTRQYGKVKGDPGAKRQKVDRLSALRSMFREAAAGSQLAFGRPAGDHRGANESEIGILFFDEGLNTTSSVLEHFPAVHAKLMEGLAVGRGA